MQTTVTSEQAELSGEVLATAAARLDGLGEDGIAEDDCGGEDVERGDAWTGHDDGLVPRHYKQGEQDGENTASHHLKMKN